MLRLAKNNRLPAGSLVFSVHWWVVLRPLVGVSFLRVCCARLSVIFVASPLLLGDLLLGFCCFASVPSPFAFLGLHYLLCCLLLCFFVALHLPLPILPFLHFVSFLCIPGLRCLFLAVSHVPFSLRNFLLSASVFFVLCFAFLVCVPYFMLVPLFFVSLVRVLFCFHLSCLHLGL